MSNGNPIIEWWVRLSGDEQELRDACENLECSEICRIQLDKDSRYYLKSASFYELVDTRDVMTKAENLVARVNGVLMALLPGFETIKVDVPVAIHENGCRTTHLLPLTREIKYKGGRPVVIRTSEDTERPSDAEKWLALSERDDDVADMLTFLSRETNWFNLYKAHEMITLRLLKQRQSLSQPPREWVKEELDDQFYLTANWYRHSSAKVKRPRVPMELDAAREYILGLVRRVLAERSS